MKHWTSDHKIKGLNPPAVWKWMKNVEKEETNFFTKKFFKRTIYLAFNPMHF